MQMCSKDLHNRARKTSPNASIAVDIDGVVGDQVPHVLARAEKEMGIKMSKQEITEWDTKVGKIPFDKLIAQYLLDPNFVLSMPIVSGAADTLSGLRKRLKSGFDQCSLG
jgi:5'(3')-deoxyribonucleotidase